MAREAKNSGKLDAIVMEQNPSHGDSERLSWFDLIKFKTTGGVLISSILDGGKAPNWRAFSLDAQKPVGASLTIEVRTGNNPSALGPFTEVPSSGGGLVGLVDTGARYLQYRLSLYSNKSSSIRW